MLWKYYVCVCNCVCVWGGGVECTWSGAYTDVGCADTIGPLQRQNDGKNVTCRAKEQQASDRQHTESTRQLDVYCK